MKKKILFISTANNIHTVRWVNSLSEYYDIYLVSCKNHTEAENKISNKVKIFTLKYKAPLGYYLNVRQLRKIYNEVQPDLINVHYASGYGTLARIAKIQPILLSIWGSDIYEFPKKSKLNYNILKKNILNAREIASTSENMKQELERIYPYLNKKIHITPFGVDTNKFYVMGNDRDDNEFRIGLVKTLEKKYAISDLILAFNKLKTNIKDKIKDINLKLYIYGQGNQEKTLKDLIKDLNLQDSVFLKGQIKNDEVPRVLNSFDLFCATSISESFGVAVVEAMACGLPVVATDADGFKEVVVNGKTGLIVKRHNIEEIANALEKLILNKEERIQFGLNARKRVLEKYDWKKNVQNMMELYENIMLKYKKGE